MTLRLEEEAAPEGFERLIRVIDEEAGLSAFICLHSTACGPAAGGCRMWPYESLDAARTDVMRLARGMTQKNAMAGLDLGGGKAVIVGDSTRDKTPALFRAFGRAVAQLEGQYYTAEDVGISPEDMAIVAQETPYAVGLEGGAHGSGDPSPFTAEGVFQCLKVGARHVFGSEDLTGRKVLVQGLGHVGWSLAQKLHEAGATLLVADIHSAHTSRAQAELNAEVVPVDQVFTPEIDIFAPCALGGILTLESAQRLSARLVCGAANNQLAELEVAEALRARGIRYLPDYVVNAGGIVSVASEIHRAGPGYRTSRLEKLAARINAMLTRASETNQTTVAVADQMVADILTRCAGERT